ncbi:hypothetical protein SADUNF_Sadunf11G0002800 [Salix dunnii]|uniref:Hexosyltransferase n=1 Tax=Salix dunnii TaxID=1413687 RepID=A0A835JP97_9ROSI|nr:hypothetical protein SADUNF_Sadunf11G0002800 [Salix dunnii]
MSVKGRGGVGVGEMGSKNVVVSRNLALLLCFSSFFAGILFTNRMWTEPERTNLEPEACGQKLKVGNHISNYSPGQISNTQNDISKFNSKISSIEMKLAAAKAEQQSLSSANAASENMKRKYFMVIGINTAFSSRKRRDSVRATWMPQGEEKKKLEEKGIVIRFVIGHRTLFRKQGILKDLKICGYNNGNITVHYVLVEYGFIELLTGFSHSSTAGGILDKAIEAEEMMHGDFLRLEHVEGYLELSSKTKTYFSTAVALWDADFYIKVDDDVHVNLATLGKILAGHKKKPWVYVGCMKSGPVLSKKGVKYYEPEYWKFGEAGNKYFRHATGQLYAISKDLATYISVNQHILHKYVNEDVSLGSWFIGLDVEHVDDKRLCCGTPPDCEWKAHLGSTCAVSFDWKCSGICRPVERMMEVHKTCGEDVNALEHASF